MLRKCFSGWSGVLGLLLVPALAALTWAGCQGTCGGPNDCGDGQFCSMSNGTCLSARALGFCRAIPDSCPPASVPVCGCDGKPYASECAASLAGQSVAGSQAACTASCGPTTPCAKGAYCRYADGACNGTAVPGATSVGTCDPIQTDCSTAPPGAVCGCDGHTYDSRCEAQRAGVSVRATGACACGGPQNVGCEAGKYCDLAVGTCADVNPVGTCATTPAGACPSIYDPVCGCDGNTYDNACEAGKKKASVYAKGGCTCGGSSAQDCNNGYFCDYGALVGGCASGTVTGTCARIPSASACTTVDGPVCGCDASTYPSTCLANAAGTSVSHAGSCGP